MHIYTMEYYSAIKRNEIELFVARWMELESVTQSEVSQKDTCTPRFIAALFTVAKTWKQPKCPSTD